MPYRIKSSRITMMVLGDAVLLALSLLLSIEVRFFDEAVPFKLYYISFLIMVPLYLMIYYISDAYNIDFNFRTSYYAARHLISTTVATLAIAIGLYLVPTWKFGRGLFLLNFLFVSLFIYGWRLFYQSSLSPIRKKSVVIIGAGNAGRKMGEVLSDSRYFSIAGYLDDDPGKWHHLIDGHGVLGGSDAILDIIAGNSADAVVVAVKYEKKLQLLETLLEVKRMGIDIYDMPTLCEDLTGKLFIDYLSYESVIAVPFAGLRLSIYKTKIKRIIDILLSSFGLMITTPIILIAACMIKLDSSGTVLYRQKRVGLNGKAYELVKLRSMFSNAEPSGALWAQKNDSRITRVGNILRSMRIDEIPQMWNVLKGEMSFIGPRPERPEFEEQLQKSIPLYTLRHAVYPGITGWAQINYRYGASKEDSFEKLQYDLYYIKHMSLLLDLQILLKTVRVVLLGSGAR